MQNEQNNLNAYIHKPVNSENKLHTCGDHLGVKIIACESDTSLTLEMLCDKCTDSPNPFHYVTTILFINVKLRAAL